MFRCHDLNPFLLEITLVLGVKALFDEVLLEPEWEDDLFIPRGFIDFGGQLRRFLYDTCFVVFVTAVIIGTIIACFTGAVLGRVEGGRDGG